MTLVVQHKRVSKLYLPYTTFVRGCTENRDDDRITHTLNSMNLKKKKNPPWSLDTKAANVMQTQIH